MKDIKIETCAKHNEAIRFYCVNHDVIRCSMCKVLGHRLCVDIKYLIDILNDEAAGTSGSHQERVIKLLNELQENVASETNSKDLWAGTTDLPKANSVVKNSTTNTRFPTPIGNGQVIRSKRL
ncbi:uncharacterized protein LOC128550920 [Mercenaria mercenaria]|uniref:uncharacterized protein LOC128550920 n=1 Tax=Mercenaria mercenaria TaxID=6596 RepID=UPI00234F1E74|nr:uncharacterized protein LOC128550920 [Mercenaria mercenaria]